MGPQFAHIETYSKKANKSGNSVDQVLAEAERDPEYSQHVANPEPPNLLFGADIPELRKMHEEMLDSSKTQVKVKGKIRERAIRSDRDTLFTVVMSYPLQHDEIKDNAEEMAKYRLWQEKNIEFLQEEFGSQLKTVLEHTDEKYPHLHAYALPDDDPACFAEKMHPGKVAKEAAGAKAKKDGLTGRAVTEVANDAYRNKMREWQNEYYLAVGLPCGLTRDGPKRARKSRKEWQEQKSAARTTAEALQTLDQKADLADDREAKLTKQAAAIDKAQTATSKKSERLAVREAEITKQSVMIEKAQIAVAKKDEVLRRREADLHKRESDYNERYGDLLVREMNVEMSESEIASKKKELSRVALFAERALRGLAEWLDVDPGKTIGAQLKKLSAAIRAAVAPDKPEDLADDDYGPDF